MKDSEIRIPDDLVHEIFVNASRVVEKQKQEYTLETLIAAASEVGIPSEIIRAEVEKSLAVERARSRETELKTVSYSPKPAPIKNIANNSFGSRIKQLKLDVLSLKRTSHPKLRLLSAFILSFLRIGVFGVIAYCFQSFIPPVAHYLVEAVINQPQFTPLLKMPSSTVQQVIDLILNLGNVLFAVSAGGLSVGALFELEGSLTQRVAVAIGIIFMCFACIVSLNCFAGILGSGY